MDPEKNSQEEHLLNVFDSSSSSAFVYKLLRNSLQSKDYYSFMKTMKENLKKQPAIVDINYEDVYEDYSKRTYLDIASQEGRADLVEFLLHNGAKPNRVNRIYNRAPIHFATEGKSSDHVKTLAALLTEETINPNLEADGETALHLAVRKEYFGLECAEQLLKKGACASIPNSTGLTALHLAAMQSHEKKHEMTKLILEKCLNLDVDSYVFNKMTARMLIEKELPNLSSLLPREQKDRKPNANQLKYYLRINDEANFLRIWPLVEISCGVAEDLLETAVQKNFDKVMQAILERFDKSLSVNNAAQAAVQRSHHAILEQLLNNMEPYNINQLIIPACQMLEMSGKRDDKTSDRLKCLNLILECEKVSVHCIDGK